MSLLSKGTKATVFTAELRKEGLPGICEKLKGRAAGAAMVIELVSFLSVFCPRAAKGLAKIYSYFYKYDTVVSGVY